MTPTHRLTSYITGREHYRTDHNASSLTYVAPCATCHHLAEYIASPTEPLRMTCPTCEAAEEARP